MRSAPIWSAVVVLALCGSAAVAAKTCAAKWAQYLDGTVVAVVQIKRAGSLCEGETATVSEQTLRFRMTCSGDEFALDVLLPHPVDESRVSVKREPGALVAVTLHKKNAALWWSSLAKHPEKFKTLLSRDFGRGDPEPDPEELEELGAELAAAVDAGGGVSQATPSSRKQAEAAEKAEQLEAQAMQDWEAALPKAQQELLGNKVSPQMIARLKALMEVLPSQQVQIGTVLGNLQLRKGDTAEGQATLRRALKRCKGRDEACKGAHQTLAESITRGGASDAATVAEAVKLYKKGAALLPDSYETYYQLGRHLNMQPKTPIGGKKAAAAPSFLPPMGVFGCMLRWRPSW